MLLKRVGCGILLFMLLLNGSPGIKQAWAEQDLAPGAQAAILYDATSGRILYQKNADKEMLIASLTKIMTAIIAIENGKMNELVTVGPDAAGVEGSSIYLKQGEKIPLSTLLYGLMLRSGNDAAVAIAEHIGGSLEGFVYMMNEKAAYLGMVHTHFVNPHGLDMPGHYSSARDLAILTAYALKNPIFQEIVKTEVKTVPWPGEKWHRKFYNKNKMLRFYKWADGVKTGYTKKARRTLVSSATKDGHQLITVTLNDGDDWKDSMNMLEYGFNHYDLLPVLVKGQDLLRKEYMTEDDQKFRVVSEITYRYPLTVDERKKITVEPVITYPLHLVEQNRMQVGTARIFLDDQLIGSAPLVVQYMNEPSVWNRWKEMMGYVFFQRWI
ncbi:MULTISPECIES: D-alanyl-D-alanine carboxypeptidase family protein [unclassified Thermoactinomyces]|jgi:serine-type D-Ala-D-Ala carboxypeptidase (penicillin-binding protein 5/6)|uniref:D-alanyl-D-alanine carboxypeptidase family protein n=1 Tax=unclassified Thermoactinomyces TaxID=2634588 RepID=UPI0018DCCA19|nr:MULTISPECIES: D-alanyl-D-alanine carboxypeptidase family protein [unclassified Thermoactinomyces]MBH8596668.1 D-alanyl-D-alanine carboxypeptidase [Thermoactinomyces sp. CICC 10523]MBH8603430.1 D-alanyl-D-alanine carboxypeptidase [Thermoactinomyces sp. CICC 10522]MBH8609270.1 D-alanyl-D-alanine carboxypeptidase [Thermoactinomyces sp. CICC 10521]